MLIDLNDGDFSESLHADICIVGSGAAGLAAASGLEGSPYRVIIAESGDFGLDARVQRLYDSEISGRRFDGAHEGRFRTLGGSTTKWGGQALPLTAFDFEKRDWVAHSGWPISHETLAPYYEKAYTYLNTDHLNFTDDLFEKLKIHPPAFNPERMRYHFSKWSPHPDLRSVYFPGLRKSSNVTFIKNANLTRIDLQPGMSSVKELEFVSLENGRRVAVTPRRVILCAGGIETARILLSNRHQQAKGIGNENDVVGRFLQDHPTLRIGSLRANDKELVQKLFNVHFYKRRKYSVRFSASRGLQESLRTLNASGSLLFDFDEGSVFKSVNNLANALRRNDARSVRSADIVNVIKKSPDLLMPVYHYLVNSRMYKPGAELHVSLMTEQEPHPDSRVELSGDKDELGIPKSKISWKPTSLTWDTVLAYSSVIREEFGKAGLGKIDLREDLKKSNPGWRDLLSDQYHHIGTTRMGNSPADSVVNGDCRLHGVDNLYLASSSVFPTGGHSNPSLTIIALTYRILDKIKSDLEGERGARV